MRILLDVDGVIADFVGAICYELDNRYVPEDFKEPSMLEAMSPWDQNRFEQLSRMEGLCESIEPYDDAKSFVEELHELGEVYAVTKPWKARTWAWERMNWLEDRFGIQRDRIIFTGQKHLVRGDVLIEDNAENLNSWHLHTDGGIALLLDRPWNRSFPCAGISAKDYETIIEVVHGAFL